MGAVFLSASIPLVGRGQCYETFDPFIIQCAVRELAIAIVRRHKIVLGGHPASASMIWNICEDLGAGYTDSVILYQSRFFEGDYPEENQRFDNVVYADYVPEDVKGSLQLMREQILSRENLIGAIFVGGMDGVGVEYDILRRFNPEAFIFPVAALAGAALNLARNNGYLAGCELEDIDFVALCSRHLPDKYSQI